MGVESNVYSPRPPITSAELTAAAHRHELFIRLFDAASIDRDGTMQEPVPKEPLEGHVVIVGWSAPDRATTLAVDGAVLSGDKFTIDRLAREGKLSWCELTIAAFNYEQFWSRHPDERSEFEASLSPAGRAVIESSRTRYALRSSFQTLNAQLLHSLKGILKDETDGVTDEG